jgi:hypothetical protein
VHKSDLIAQDFTSDVIDQAIRQSSLYPVREDSDWLLVLPITLNTLSTNTSTSVITTTPTKDAGLLTESNIDPAILDMFTEMRGLIRDLVMYFAMLGFDDIPESLVNLLDEEEGI